MIRPDSKFIFWLVVLAGCTTSLLFIDGFMISILMVSIFAVLIIADAVLLYRNLDIEVVRTHNETMPLGVKAEINLKLINKSSRNVHFELFDHYPAIHGLEGLPLTVDLRAKQQASASCRNYHGRLTICCDHVSRKCTRHGSSVPNEKSRKNVVCAWKVSSLRT